MDAHLRDLRYFVAVAEEPHFGRAAERLRHLRAAGDRLRLPVTDLPPARLAIAWRRGERRLAVRDFVRACRDAAGP